MSINIGKDWVDGLDIIKEIKNRNYHSAIKMSPFQALFGQKAEKRVYNKDFPDGFLDDVTTEDELLRKLQKDDENNLPYFRFHTSNKIYFNFLNQLIICLFLR